MINSKYIINGRGRYSKKDIKDMNVMELIEEITETTKIAALNLWGTNRERTNIAIDECAQKQQQFITHNKLYNIIYTHSYFI